MPVNRLIAFYGKLSRFLRATSGATVIEYALVAAGIGLVILMVVNRLGGVIRMYLGNIYLILFYGA